jgi:ABC-type transport system involved in cytochrome c biogenesis permease component
MRRPLAFEIGNVSMQRKAFMKWVSASLIGHVVLLELIYAIPFMFTFIVLNYSQGTLTAAWAAYIVIGSVALGAIGAVFIWFTITLPRIRRYRGFKG